VHKTYVRKVAFGGIKGDDMKAGGIVLCDGIAGEQGKKKGGQEHREQHLIIFHRWGIRNEINYFKLQQLA
jgi:hypothetical protein